MCIQDLMFKGQSVQRIEWKQTDRQTDGRTDRRTDGLYRLLYLPRSRGRNNPTASLLQWYMQTYKRLQHTVYPNSTHFHSAPPPGRQSLSVKYCGEHVCLSVGISQEPDVPTPNNVTKFSVQVVCGSVFLWRLCNTLCASGFVDGVMVSRNGRPMAQAIQVGSKLKLSAGGSIGARAESDFIDCLVGVRCADYTHNVVRERRADSVIGLMTVANVRPCTRNSKGTIICW